VDTYQLDAKLILADGAAATTANGFGQVGAANQILDFGGAPPRSDLGIVGGSAAARFAVVIDISAIKVTSTNETYSIDILGSNIAAGTNPISLGALKVGYGTATPNGTIGLASTGAGSTTSPGRFIIFATSEQNDIKYEFIYLYVTVGGTTPSITFKAFASMWPFE
jgi:hypothetical protein